MAPALPPCCTPSPPAGQIQLLAGLRLLVVSYLSNLAGCLLMVGLFTGGSIYPGRDHYLVHLGEAKCSAEWGVVLVRGEWAP
jgi:formate/nitrite transporter FocA (FNT family)